MSFGIRCKCEICISHECHHVSIVMLFMSETFNASFPLTRMLAPEIIILGGVMTITFGNTSGGEGVMMMG